MKKFISSIVIIVFVFSMGINLVNAQSIDNNTIINLLNSLLKANLIPAQNMQTAKSLLGNYSADTKSYSVSIDNISPNVGTFNTEVIIKGTGFTTNDNWVSFEGVTPVLGIRQWNLSSEDGQTLKVKIPNTILQTSEAYSGTKEVEVSPGLYQITVSNSNGKSVPQNFTVNTSSCFNYTRDLTVGSTGDDVIALQIFLENKGLLELPPEVSRGYFGLTTKSALATYQGSYPTSTINPSEYGYFGASTRSVIATDCGGSTAVNIIVTSPSDGTIYDAGPSQKITTKWSKYNGDFDYYRVTLSNGVIGNDPVLQSRINKKTNEYTINSQKLQEIMKKNWKRTDLKSYFIVEAIKKTKGNEKVVSVGGSGTFEIITLSKNSNAPTVTLSASTDAIYSDGKGGTVTLSWKSKNTSYCMFEKQRVNTSGTKDVYIDQTGTFTMSCVGKDGLEVSSNPVTVKFVLTSTQQSCSAFSRDLTLGSGGSDVYTLQSFLEAKGYLIMPIGVAKGYFGSETQSALTKYQTANGISPADGYFGSTTRASVCKQI